MSGDFYTDTENLEIVILEDVLYLTIQNDMALCFHDELDLFEHQRVYAAINKGGNQKWQKHDGDIWAQAS